MKTLSMKKMLTIRRSQFVALLAFFLISLNTTAQDVDAQDFEGASCTSIMVGKDASTDGSVMTSHTCDSWYRTWVRWEKAQEHEKGAMQKIYRGTMHTQDPYDSKGLKEVGEIPQAEYTYAYLNTAYPCLNEKQLAIGETTFSGPDTLVNPEGMFMIEELERIVLQRCDNARDVIRLIDELTKEYGYGDGGECITIADPNEVWCLEIMGEGKKKKGAIWAAQRVPDGEVSVSANIPRIKYLNREDPDNFMCSDNIEKVAKKHGLWDGEGEFIWYKVFGNDYSNGKNFREREWFILNALAPSLGLSMEDEDLPFSVKPDEKVDARKVMELLRSTYEGTELDMTRNLKMVNRKGDTIVSPIANPWMGGNDIATYNFIAPGIVESQRTVSVSWCSYSFVAQLRSWMPDEIGGILWYGVENPGQSPRIPIFTGSTQLPSCFDECGHGNFNEETILWRYRKANKLAQLQWGSTKETMINNILRYEEKAMKEIPSLEKEVMALLEEGKKEEAQKLMNRYTADFEAATAQTWKEMEQSFWERFWVNF